MEEPTRARHDRGFSIVEVVVTITLMAIVIVPIMNAVVVSIKASSQSRSAAQVETALVNAADRVNRAPRNCNEGSTPADIGYTGYVIYSLQTQGWTPSEAAASVVVHHSYYAPDSTPDWVDGVCKPGTAVNDNVQRVIVSITSRDGDIQRKIEVVKSRV